MALLGSPTVVSGMSGKFGGGTFRRTKHGLVYQKNSHPIRFRTVSGTQVSQFFARGSVMSSKLTPAQKAAWNVWGAMVPKRQRMTTDTYQSTPHDLMTGLAVGFGIANHGDMGPFTDIPPSIVFDPDGLVLTAATGAPHGITFTADIPNTPSVVTVIRLQLLPKEGSLAQPHRYRIRGVHTFIAGHLSITLTKGLVPGRYYHVAYNEILSDDGQQSDAETIEDAVLCG